MIRIENIFYKKKNNQSRHFIFSSCNRDWIGLWNAFLELGQHPLGKNGGKFSYKKINHFSIGFFLTTGEYLPNAHHDKDYFQELF